MQWVKDNGEPSGGYIEGGRELVGASLNGGPVGTFQTGYRFQGKYDPAYIPNGVGCTGAASTRSPKAPGPARSPE
jgi:hypothetical protein